LHISIVGLLKGIHRCRGRGLIDAEAMVVHFAGRKDGGEGLAELLTAAAAEGEVVVDWAVQVTLDKQSGSSFRVKSLGPALLRGSSTLMHRAVGCVRACVHVPCVLRDGAFSAIERSFHFTIDTDATASCASASPTGGSGAALEGRMRWRCWPPRASTSPAAATNTSTTR
jgi:hypothetical protein